MTNFDFLSLGAIVQHLKDCNMQLSFNPTEILIHQIRHLHFIKGYTYGEIKNELKLEPGAATNEFFLKVLGYLDWGDYHVNRDKILELLNNEAKKT